MKAHKDKEYVLHYSQVGAEQVISAIKESSDNTQDIPRFLQYLWKSGYKLEPIKISNKSFSFNESIAVFESMIHKNIPDFHKTKIFDILRDCPKME